MSQTCHNLEVTGYHSIIFWARASNVGGTSMPSTFAVFTLITNSNTAFDWQFSWIRSFQNTINIVGEPSIGFRQPWSVGVQSTRLREIGPSRDNRRALRPSKIDNLLTIYERYRVGEYDNRLRAPSAKRRSRIRLSG
jgi:hypothetical protein